MEDTSQDSKVGRLISHPLSSVQQVVWLDQITHPEVPHYNIGMVVQIDGAIDLDILAQAINDVAKENDALRIVLHQGSGVAQQSIAHFVRIDPELVEFEDHENAESAVCSFTDIRTNG